LWIDALRNSPERPIRSVCPGTLAVAADAASAGMILAPGREAFFATRTVACFRDPIDMHFASAIGLTTDLAIDLGTANTCVFAPGRGIVLNEPSMVAFNTRDSRIEAVGTEAKEMLGRTPGNMIAVKPLRDGVIADFEAAEKMLGHFIRKAHRRSGWVRPRVVIGVPAEITQVERRAVQESALRAKVSEVHLIEEPMAAAIGAGLPITEPTGNMIVDIGGGTTDIAVISLAGLVYSKSVRVAGNEMDESIIDYMRKAHGLLVGERTAEEIKIEIGSAAPLDDARSMEVKGRHMADGVPKSVFVSDGEVREALSDTVNVIVRAVRDALERIPPELSADIYDRGIVITGGGAMLRNLDKRLREDTQLPVQIAEEPLSSVVLGAGKMLSDMALLRRLAA
jgi:rod shape-determining protein MreB